jgi:hypothetical protein
MHSLGGRVGGGGSEGSHMGHSSCRLGKSKAKSLWLKLQYKIVPYVYSINRIVIASSYQSISPGMIFSSNPSATFLLKGATRLLAAP